MMLIGKTANWLLRHSVHRCAKAIDKFVRMRSTNVAENGRKCFYMLNF